jgi:hypothetical protein
MMLCSIIVVLIIHLVPAVTSFSSSLLCSRCSSGRTALGTKTLVSSINVQQTTRSLSDELLSLLLQKASTSKPDNNLDDEINSLVRRLISSKSSFDPKDCIDGPLFTTIHFIGDTPLWEKIAIGNVRNVKGQRYTLLDNTSGNFVNYAEIWGQNLYLKAVGKFVEKGSVASLNTEVGDVSSSNNPLDVLTSFFSKDHDRNKPTPFDYEAIVSGASIVLFGKYTLNVDIEGTGTVRVLYADPSLRIFLSPTDTEVTRGAGDWESSGLIVVQVKNDLVYDDRSDQTMEE